MFNKMKANLSVKSSARYISLPAGTRAAEKDAFKQGEKIVMCHFSPGIPITDARKDLPDGAVGNEYKFFC